MAAAAALRGTCRGGEGGGEKGSGVGGSGVGGVGGGTGGGVPGSVGLEMSKPSSLQLSKQQAAFSWHPLRLRIARTA